MRIPTIISDEQVHSGSTGPTAQPVDFGLGIASSVGQLQETVHQGMSDIRRLEIANKEKQHLQDITWASEAVSVEKNYVNKWMADPENNTRETYAEDLQKMMTSRISEYNDSARSTRALQLFRQHMLAFGSERYETALHASARTTLNNSALAISGQSANAMTDYRLSRSIPGVNASQDLVNNVQRIEGNIDEMFGVVSPALQVKLKEQLWTDATYALMNDDPTAARWMVGHANTIDEHTRKTLLDAVDQASRSKDAVELEAFNQLRRDHITAVANGKTRDKLSLDLYNPYYPRDKAQALKMRDDALIDTHLRANDMVSKMASWDTAYQAEEVGKLRASAKTEQDADVLEIVTKKVHEQTLLQDRNPVSWLQQNNPIVKNALKVAQESNDQNRLQTMSELYDMTLKYQGKPPKDAPPDERKMFMNLPKNSHHLMTAEEALQNADEINKGSPKQMLETINQVMARYPDPAHQDIAFNDMVTMPKNNRGIKQEYQLAFLNRNAHWVDGYLGAIQEGESIKSVTPEKLVEYEKALKTDPGFTAFSHAMMGDNFQRGDEVAGFKNGILSYAYALSTSGKESPKSAIARASKMLIGEELGFASIHGHTLMVAKDRGAGKPPWTDNDMPAIGQSLEHALEHINPAEVKLMDQHGRAIFPILMAAGTEPVRMQGLMNAIRERGFFQTSNDGKSATLYYHDGNHAFEIRDKDDQAFSITFDDVMMNPPRRVLAGEPGRYSGVPPFKTEFDRGEYPTASRYTTNWPTVPGYIRKVPRYQRSAPAKMAFPDWVKQEDNPMSLDYPGER